MSTRLLRWARSPKALVGASLVLLMVLATIVEHPARVAAQMVVASLVAVFLDAVVARVRGTAAAWDSGIVTGLLVAVVLVPGTAVTVVAIAAALSIASKHLVRTSSFHVFNPVAVGLLGTVLLYPSAGQSWWGALGDLPVVFVLVVIATGALIAYRVRKLPAVLAFLGIFFAAFTVAALVSGSDPRVAEVFRVPFVNAVVFFSCYMLIDPKTSPSRVIDQVAFGALAAASSVAAFLFVGGMSYLLAGLLIANAAYALRRTQTDTPELRPRAAAPPGQAPHAAGW